MVRAIWSAWSGVNPRCKNVGKVAPELCAPDAVVEMIACRYRWRDGRNPLRKFLPHPPMTIREENGHVSELRKHSYLRHVVATSRLKEGLFGF